MRQQELMHGSRDRELCERFDQLECELQGRLERCVGQLHDGLQRQFDELQDATRHQLGRLSSGQGFGERLDALERSLEGRLQRVREDVQSQLTALQDGGALRSEQRWEQHLAERMASAEAQIKARLEQRMEELHQRDIDQLKHIKDSAESHFASIEMICQELDNRLGDVEHEELDPRLRSVEARLREQPSPEQPPTLRQSSSPERRRFLAVDERYDKLQHEIQSRVSAKMDMWEEEIKELRESMQKALAESMNAHSEELEGVQAKVQKAIQKAHQSSDSDRIHYLEEIIGDSADKHAQAFDAAHTKLEQIAMRLSACEDRIEGQDESSVLKERVDNLETFFGASSEKHAKTLQAAHAKLEQIHGRLVACEERGGDGTGTAAPQQVAPNEAASLRQRADDLERGLRQLDAAINEQSEQVARELAGAKLAVDEIRHRVDGTSASHGHERRTASPPSGTPSAEGMADLAARIASCEAHGKALSNSVNALAGEAATVEAVQTSSQKCQDYVESRLGESVGKLAASLEMLQAGHEALASRSESVKADEVKALIQQEAETQVAKRLADLKKDLSLVQAQAQDAASGREAASAQLQARVVLLERLLVGEAAATAEDTTVDDPVVPAVGGFAQRLDALEEALRTAEQRAIEADAVKLQLHNELRSHLKQEQALRESQDVALESRILAMAASAGSAEDKAAVDSMRASLGALGERLDHLERELGESSPSHSQASSPVKAGATPPRPGSPRSCWEQLAHERKTNTARSPKVASWGSCSLRDRVEYLERTFGDRLGGGGGGGGGPEQGSPAAGSQAPPATVTQRLREIEKFIHHSFDDHVKQLTEVQSKVGDVSSHVSQEVAKRMNYLTVEKDAQEAHNSSVLERVARLEGAELARAQSFEAVNHKIAGEVGARVTQQAKLVERLEAAERTIAEKGQALSVQQAKLQHLEHQVQGARSALEVSRTSLDALSVEVEGRQESQTTMLRRIERLESHVQEASLELEAAKLEKAAVTKKLEGIEAEFSDSLKRRSKPGKELNDHVDRQAKVLASANAKLDQMRAQAASDRAALESLQRSFRERLADEGEARERGERAIEERVEELEAMLGERGEEKARALGISTIPARIDALEQAVHDLAGGKTGSPTRASPSRSLAASRFASWEMAPLLVESPPSIVDVQEEQPSSPFFMAVPASLAKQASVQMSTRPNPW